MYIPKAFWEWFWNSIENIYNSIEGIGEFDQIEGDSSDPPYRMHCNDYQCYMLRPCEEILKFLDDNQVKIEFNVRLKDEDGAGYDVTVGHNTLFIKGQDLYPGAMGENKCYLSIFANTRTR